MKKAKGLSVSEEPVVETGEVETEEAKGLSLRDALEVAYEGTKADGTGAGDVRDSGGAAPNTSQSSGSGDLLSDEAGTDAGSSRSDSGTNERALEPPAEYTAEEKEDFRQLSRKGQEAQLRLHKSRQGKLEEVKSAIREFEHAKKLAGSVDPYIRAMGLKESPEVALQKALTMWHEFEKGDPKKAAAAYLQAKGIPVPESLLEDNSQTKKLSPEEISLRERVDALTSRIAQEDNARVTQTLQQAWSSFEQEKNAAGKAKYPDINESESGLRLASNIGSLVSGKTELSKQFIAHAQARIPGLTYPKLFEEAYRYYGGRVDETEAPRSQDSQTHIATSRRAAASVPGRGAQTARATSTVKKYSSYREAAAAALADLNRD